jgi:hypothetical protein
MIEMPILLLGLLAAGVPIVIHLLHRHRTTPIPWGAMMFLEESSIQQRRRRTIEEWLLLLLRIALLALLAFLLARPVLGAGRLNPFSSHATTDIAVVMDHSISSGLRGNGQTDFQKQTGLLRRLTTMLRPGDTLSVILAEHRPVSLSQLPVSASDRAALRRDFIRPLSHEPPGLTGSSIPAAIAVARRMVDRGSNFQKVILVLSNQRAISWRVDHPALWSQALRRGPTGPGKMLVYDVPVGVTPTLSNLSVGSIHIQPALVGVGRPARLSVSIANSGPLPLTHVPIHFLVDGKMVTERIIADLAAGKSKTISFRYRFNNAGSHWLKVQADVHDALPADNNAIAAVNVRRHLPVLIIDSQAVDTGGFRASRFLALAMQPFSSTLARKALIQPQVVSVSSAQSLQLARYAAVVVNDPVGLPRRLLGNLGDYARAGHGLWFILGPNTTPEFVDQALPAAGLSVATLGPLVHAANSPMLVIKRPGNSMVHILAALHRNMIVGVTLTKWWRLLPAGPLVKVLLATAGGDPIILEKSVGIEGGKVVMWSTPVDGSWNDWPTAAGSFVPLVDQSVYALALGGSQHTRRHFLNPGDSIVWTGPVKPTVQSAKIINPVGVAAAVQPQITADGKYLMVYNHTQLPGLYQAVFKPGSIPQPVYYSVAIDSRELNPQLVSKADLSWLTHQHFIQAVIKPEQIPGVLNSVLVGVELWPWLALLVMAMLLGEVLLCRRLLASPRAALPQEVSNATF